MQIVYFEKETVAVHTKVSATVKAAAERLAKRENVDLNVMLNTLLVKGIKATSANSRRVKRNQAK